MFGVPASLDRGGQPPEYRPGEAHPQVGRCVFVESLNQIDLAQDTAGVLGDAPTHNAGLSAMAGPQKQPGTQGAFEVSNGT